MVGVFFFFPFKIAFRSAELRDFHHLGSTKPPATRPDFGSCLRALGIGMGFFVFAFVEDSPRFFSPPRGGPVSVSVIRRFGGRR